MKQRLAQWMESVDALAFRERALILAGGIAILFLMMDALVYQPALTQQERLNDTIGNLQLGLTVLEQQAKELSNSDQADPVQTRQRRIAALENEGADLSQVIQEQLGLVMDPEQTNQILRDILEQDKELTLLELETEVLGLADTLGTETGADEAALLAGMSRYQLTLRLKGNYLATTRFLRTLEALPWALFWEQLDLQVTEHPYTEVDLKIYTLGSYGGGA